MLRKLLGSGTPRILKNRAANIFAILTPLPCWMARVLFTRQSNRPTRLRVAPSFWCRTLHHRSRSFGSSATGC